MPHHGVYHPLKPEKIHVVLDCSSEYRERSINKELLARPDLTNQIVRTLIKFRQDKVAFVADTEYFKYMFQEYLRIYISRIYIKNIYFKNISRIFQVYVSNEHRSLLCFLWWQDGDISRQPVDHEMCVHVSGGTSPPSCSNYALKRTAVDGEDQFGKEAAETLQNVYVDDVLKSLDDEDKAMKLINEMKNMCASGGFRLTKFLSNSKKVLQ